MVQLGHVQKCVTVYEDNEGAIYLAENPLGSARCKHVDVRHHFLREPVAKQEIKIGKVSTKKQHVEMD